MQAGIRRKTVSGITKFVLALMLVAAAVCIILFSNKNVVSADESGTAIRLNKYYKSITIEPGDTLWSIAQEYKSGDYPSTEAYVRELMDINGVHNGNITAGRKLIVAYYAE